MSVEFEKQKTAFCSYVSQIQENESPSDSVYENIFDQYERVVVQALATSFGLDFLIRDQHGGDVDTIHNVREIGKDSEMTYKNQNNARNYNDRGEYNTKEYHAGGNFQRIKHDTRKDQINNGFMPIEDQYTGKKNLGFYGKSGPSDRNAELDHVVEAKAIHDDTGRVLAELNGAKLADAEENFAWTNKSLNTSMGSWARHRNEQWRKEHGTDAPLSEVDMKAYIKAHPDLDEDTKSKILDQYEKSRNAYEAKINRAYYTSKKFWKDSGTAALKLGLKMGLRQALGLVFTEIWFTVKDAMIECRKNGENLFQNIAKAVKKGLKNAKKKFRDIWNKFIEGSIAGVLSSLVTTLANIFFTTAKNIIKIIRETWASFTQACNILFINPDSYPLGERFVAAAKILATGASVVAGSMVSQLLTDCPVGKIPVVGEILPTFCSVLVTGIMSCSFLYLLDHNKGIKKVVEMLNNLPDIDNFNYALKKQGELLDRYLAELMNLDLVTLKKQEHAFSAAANQLSLVKTSEEANTCLRNIYSDLGMELPWKGYRSLDSFIANKKSRLVFE